MGKLAECIKFNYGLFFPFCYIYIYIDICMCVCIYAIYLNSQVTCAANRSEYSTPMHAAYCMYSLKCSWFGLLSLEIDCATLILFSRSWLHAYLSWTGPPTCEFYRKILNQKTKIIENIIVLKSIHNCFFWLNNSFLLQ